MALAAFVSDVCSRRIIGWRTAASMPTELPPDAFGDGVVDPCPRRADRPQRPEALARLTISDHEYALARGPAKACWH